MKDEPTYYESKFDEAYNILMAATDIKKNEGCAFMMIGIDKSPKEGFIVMGSCGGKTTDIAEAMLRVLTDEGEASEQLRHIFHTASESANIWRADRKRKGMLRSIFGARKQQ